MFIFIKIYTMKKQLLFACILAVGLYSAQKSDQISNRDEDTKEDYAQMANYEKIDGTPYLDKYFLKAEIPSAKKSMDLRYNAYSDEMEYVNDGKINYLTKINGLDINFSNGKSYEVCTYKKDGAYNTGYLEILDAGKMGLYRKSTITIERKDPSDKAFSKTFDQLQFFKKNNDVYFLKYDDSFKVLPKASEEIANIVPAKKTEILAFMKSHKTKLNKDSDLIALVDYINTLLK